MLIAIGAGKGVRRLPASASLRTEPSPADVSGRCHDRRKVRLDIKAQPTGQSGFRPIAHLYKGEHALPSSADGGDCRAAMRAARRARPGFRSRRSATYWAGHKRSLAYPAASTPPTPGQSSVPRYGTSPRAHGPEANADSAQAYASLQEASHGWGSATSKVSTPSLIA
jgi:hypothetical protein